MVLSGMFRSGAISLASGNVSLNRRLYQEVTARLPHIVDSFIGYFGCSEFVELVGHPWPFSVLCESVDLRSSDAGNIAILVSALMDNLRRGWQIFIAGGLYTKRFNVPQMVERAAIEMGLSEAQVEWLKYSSRMAAKVDDVAVQDGYKLWLHVIVFSDVNWSVLQLASKAGFHRLYQWHSGRLQEKRFTLEPHTGVLSAARSTYALDFTARENLELQKGCVEVLAYPVSRLRALGARLSRGQTTLTDFKDGAYAGDVNPLEAPVRISWSSIAKVSGTKFSSFEELLAVKGIGSETLRFLAICSHRYLGILPHLQDKAILFDAVPSHAPRDRRAVEIAWDLLEAVRYSQLPLELRRSTAARLEALLEEAS
jgi:hypothetical protein